MSTWPIHRPSRVVIGVLVTALPIVGLPFIASSAGASPAKAVAAADTGDGALERPDAISAMVTARASGKRVEDVSQRSETTQVFANPEGNWTSEAASGPVRVQDEASGEWEDIDTALVPIEGGFAPKAALGELVLSDGGDATFASMKIEGRDLDWKWPTALPEPTIEGNQATYPDVIENGDLVVTATPTGFSHDVVLREAPTAPLTVQTPIVTSGPVVAEEPNGSLSVSTKAGEELISAPAPVMFDAGEDSAGMPDNVSPLDVQVTKNATGAVVSLTPDPEFLSDPETEYPVTIDPSYGQTQYANSDTWVYTASPTAIHPYDDELIVGTNNSGGTKYRTFVSFPTGAWNNARILGATLYMRNFETLYCSNTYNVYAQRLLGAFSGTTTWNNQPSATGIGSDGTTAAYGKSGCSTPTDLAWTVTSIVQSWADHTAPNYGFRIAAGTETANQAFRKFRSIDYTTASTGPRLSVTYDHYPNKPGKFTIDEQTGSWVRSLTPTLRAVVSDPNGGSVRGRFNIYNSSGAVVYYADGTSVASGGTSTLKVPAGKLTEGTQYTLRAFANDGTVFSGNANFTTGSLLQTVTVDSIKPTMGLAASAYASSGSWLDQPPSANSFTLNGASDVVSYKIFKDGIEVKNPPVPDASGDATVDWNPTPGGHEFKVIAADAAGNLSDPAVFTFGSGPLAMTSPTSGTGADPLTSTTSTIPILAAGRLEAGSSGTPTAKLRWRLAASGGNAATGWTTASTSGTNPDASLNVAIGQGGSNGVSWVSVSGSWDTRTATQPTGATTPLDPRKQALFEVQICVDYGGTVGEKCSWGAGGASGEQRVLRVPHAFGGNYPVAEVPGGQAALWTGELSVSGSDAVVPAPSGDLSVSRTANSFENPQATVGSTPSVEGVFGPGWVASLDGNGAGDSDSRLVDSSRSDGTLAVVDAEGNALVFGSSQLGSLTRRTTADLAVKTWVPLDEDTALSGTTLAVTGTGSGTKVKVTDAGGTVTTFEPIATGVPSASADGIFVVASVDEAGADDTTTYTRDSAGRVTRILAAVPSGVGTCSPTGALAAGCRALGITYASSTTATSSAPGDVSGQVKRIDMLIGSTSGGVDTTQTTELARYAYDSSKRLVSVTDPRPSPNLTTAYSYDGTSTRVKTITPAGLRPITYNYSSDRQRLTTVTRTQTEGSGEARQATLVYDVPVKGSAATSAGLPSLDSEKVGAWNQGEAPFYAAAVFGPDEASVSTDPAQVTTAQWKSADLSYTTDRGAVVNTANYGTSETGWTYTSTSYDASDNTIRELDAGDIAAIDSGEIAAVDAGTNTAYNSPQTVADASAPGGTRTVLEAGSVVTDTWGPARWILTADGQRAWVRPRTHTDYDQNAPNGGINPDTGLAYGLPTTVTVTAQNAAPGPNLGNTVETYSVTRTAYGSAIAGDTNRGWALGLEGTVTIVMTGSAGSSTTDIVSESRYDTLGRLTSTRQPMSNGNDAGTRVTQYYTAGSSGDCVNSAWAGAVCRTTFAGTPDSGPALISSTITDYSELLAPKTVEERPSNGGSVLRTTTTAYGTDGRVTSSSVSSSVAGSTPVGASTYAYDGATGLPTTTTTAATGGSPGGTVTTGYDAWSRPTTYSIKNGSDPTETTTTSYDSAGRVSTVQDPKGTTTWTYNGTDAAGKTEHRGVPTKLNVTNPGGRTLDVVGAYDASGALVRQDLPGGIIQRTSYDAAGEPTALAYSGQVISDEDGDGTSTVDPDGQWLAWSQQNDALGRVRREWTPSGAGFNPGGPDGTSGSGTNAAAAGYARDYTYDRAARLVAVIDQSVPNVNASTGGVDPDSPETLMQTVCQRRDYGFDRNGRRISVARTPAAADGTCQASGGQGTTTKNWTYDSADRITTGYNYDALGRATGIPQTDTPAANGPSAVGPGALAISYYDTDAAKTVRQTVDGVDSITSYDLDAEGRRLSSSTGPVGGTPTSSMTRHYTDSTDNPGWTDLGGDTRERYAVGLDGSLALTITRTGSGTPTTGLAVTDPHTDVVGQITLPSSGNAVSIDGWGDHDEYGNISEAGALGLSALNATPNNTADGSVAYGWLGGKERAIDPSGIILMGARLYNSVTGQFTSTDPVAGGNSTGYAYPQDPVNGLDLDGQMFGWAKKSLKGFGKKWKRNANGCSDHKLKACGRLFVNNVEAITAVTGVSGAARGGLKWATKKAAKSCRNSFEPGTLVLLANGETKAIEDVEVGDVVWSTDPRTHESAAEPVTDLISGDGSKDLVRVGVDENHDGVTEWVTGTANHPFWVRSRGWVNAGNLKVRDKLVDPEGLETPVVSIHRFRASHRVYNLTVATLHTYYIFIGKTARLVHNSCRWIPHKKRRVETSDHFDTQEQAEEAMRRMASTGGRCRVRGTCRSGNHVHVDFINNRQEIFHTHRFFFRRRAR